MHWLHRLWHSRHMSVVRLPSAGGPQTLLTVYLLMVRGKNLDKLNGAKKSHAQRLLENITANRTLEHGALESRRIPP